MVGAADHVSEQGALRERVVVTATSAAARGRGSGGADRTPSRLAGANGGLGQRYRPWRDLDFSLGKDERGKVASGGLGRRRCCARAHALGLAAPLDDDGETVEDHEESDASQNDHCGMHIVIPLFCGVGERGAD